MLERYLGEPLIVVTRLRRTEKTLLILSALDKPSIPYVFFNSRSVVRSRRELYQLISSSLTDFLSRISGREKPYKTLLKFLNLERPLLSEIFTVLNEVSEEHGIKIVVVFDEL